MKIGHPYDHYRTKVELALTSKLEEFELLGYGTISEQSLWDFLTKKKWRKPKEGALLFEIVQDIMSVNVGDYMNYATIEALKESEFSFNNSEDLKELLK